jgi:hypothetical protein
MVVSAAPRAAVVAQFGDVSTIGSVGNAPMLLAVDLVAPGAAVGVGVVACRRLFR